MKKTLKVADYHPKSGIQKRTVYVGDNGELFEGPEYDVKVGYTYVVEVGTKKFEDRYFNIIKFVSQGEQR